MDIRMLEELGAFPSHMDPVVERLRYHVFTMLEPPYTVDYRVFDDGDYTIEIRTTYTTETGKVYAESVCYDPDESLIIYRKYDESDGKQVLSRRVLETQSPSKRRLFDGRADDEEENTGREPDPEGSGGI